MKTRYQQKTYSFRKGQYVVSYRCFSYHEAIDTLIFVFGEKEAYTYIFDGVN
jgi:hypothetical protein